MTGTYPARRTRTGALVIVLPPDDARELIGTLVDLVAPSGERATGRVDHLGGVWVDNAGTDRVYAYLAPDSIVAGVA